MLGGSVGIMAVGGGGFFFLAMDVREQWDEREVQY